MTSKASASSKLTIFISGDVMIGRGIDQILPFPSEPTLHESFMKSALGYLELAEATHGPIPHPVDYPYIWGEAIREWEGIQPDARIINLETSITTSSLCAPKGINYRMHPQNIPCLTAAKIDCCVLANNHILDWKEPGLLETLETLKLASIKTAGAGRTLKEAESPAVLNIPHKGRILVFSFCTTTSGVPQSWSAASDRPGVNFLEDFSPPTLDRIQAQIDKLKGPNDIVIASIHWGPNWGYEIPTAHQKFARDLIDKARVDIIHGHSSHHPLGMELYRNKLILYGCGDFINDYEGISGYEEYRGDLSLMYFATLVPSTGELISLQMIPMQIKQFRLQHASKQDALWLKNTLNRESRTEDAPFQVKVNEDNSLELTF